MREIFVKSRTLSKALETCVEVRSGQKEGRQSASQHCEGGGAPKPESSQMVTHRRSNRRIEGHQLCQKDPLSTHKSRQGR